MSDAGATNLPDSQAVERLLRSTALAQDYQLPLAPHLAALSELLCKNHFSLYFFVIFIYLLLFYVYILVLNFYIRVCSRDNTCMLKC